MGHGLIFLATKYCDIVQGMVCTFYSDSLFSQLMDWVMISVIKEDLQGEIQTI